VYLSVPDLDLVTNEALGCIGLKFGGCIESHLINSH